MRRGTDIANMTINVSQLVIVIGAVWGAAAAYFDIKHRVTIAEQRQIQLQSQLGEVNAHLARLGP